MNVKAFIVHLERATDRHEQVERLKQQCPIPVEVVEAVDSEALENESVRERRDCSHFKPSYPFQLRLAEIACFYSHRKCWQAIVDQNLDGGLILEDDVELDVTVFNSAFDLALRHFTLEDYVRFPQKCRERAASIRASTATHRLIVPEVTGLGMIGQLVGQNAAKSLLEHTQRFDRPVDAFLQMTWQTGVQPISVYPGGITERSAQLGGSCIGKRKSWRETLKREILRPLYRHKLASCARRSAQISF
ncbi:glycosyltransferase family 25 protein [Bythopirellula goksoeyrii]|uniref:Glycosyltransferase family 25 (LPS biosynthesis protein) n=1 Tax=Bythopirellula goksoeyrii TaxID=1400387 RepID=A0A5B9QKR6_9BACT|nr:glycosyltransferase family 25 protein [Bythopirellula goksoeyrii]QEG34721.1 Glycosyltransferase family 25 (LPS biosynthesis protein) [Bythopirellula goksoeyrii]